MKKHQIVFISANTGWGGSEELWSQTAACLANAGHHVSAIVELSSGFHPHVPMLKLAGCTVVEFSSLRLPWIMRALNRVLPYGRAFTPRAIAAKQLSRVEPDLIVISQWGNLDGIVWATICREQEKPYVVIAHQASTSDWPKDPVLEDMRLAYQTALKSYFVSHGNLELTQFQMAARLNNAEVVRNPFLVKVPAALPWPPDEKELKLACVARLSAKDKGQDLLLRVLAQPKWRNRNLKISLFGTGLNQVGLQQLAQMLALESVTFCGQAADITAIWREHHALVLSSRHEGLPMAIVEAMMCGRPCIVTDIAGNAEVVENELTGFVAAAPTMAAVDEAMERAWHRRGDWQQMGLRAAARIRELVPANPVEIFAHKLLRLLESADD